VSKALRNKRNVEDEAAQKERMKLRFKVFEIWFDCDEKEKAFKILETYFIESQTEVQAMHEEKSKLEETTGRKISELEASNAEKDNRIASLEAELKRAKEEHEAKTTKIMQASIEVAVNLSIAQVKIDDLKDGVNHVRGLNENYRILLANCHTLGNRCHNEFLKTFSSTGALCKEKNFSDGDLEGLMSWVLSETPAFKSVL
jgi:molecular chaperone GrpE (heat shock protein)